MLRRRVPLAVRIEGGRKRTARLRPAGAGDLLETRAEAEALIGRAVDVVDLHEASPILAWQVLKHGRLLVDRDPGRRHRFTALTPGRREDLLIAPRPVEEALIARVEVGRVDG